MSEDAHGEDAERRTWRIDDELVAAWRDAHAAGETIRGIAARWDVNPTTVRRHLGTTGRPRGPRGRTDITRAEVEAALRVAGTVAGAARRLGVSRNVVTARLDDTTS